MKYFRLIYCFVLFITVDLTGQQAVQNISGQVSFLSPQNVYVRFGNTEGISVNDTLYINSGDKIIPALVVVNLSSTSCMCTAITTEALPVGHLIVARKRQVPPKRIVKTLEEVKAETPATINRTWEKETYRQAKYHRQH